MQYRYKSRKYLYKISATKPVYELSYYKKYFLYREVAKHEENHLLFTGGLRPDVRSVLGVRGRRDRRGRYGRRKRGRDLYYYTIGELEIPYDENGAAALDALGLFKGTGAGYALDENLTRAQAIVMVLRMIGEEDEVRAVIGDRHFIDTYGHWAGDAIEYAYGRGYINGASENECTPERNVTGREFVKMLLGARWDTIILR